MDKNRFSLMTFPLDMEILKKKMTIADTFHIAADSGLRYVDVMRIQPNKIQEYQNAIAQTGVKIYCYIGVISFFEEENKIIKSLEQEIQTAKNVGASLFMIVPYYAMIDTRKAKRMGRTETLNKLVRGFQLAVKLGKKYSLKICFETTPQDCICLSGTEDCKYVLERVPDLGLVLDTANMLPHGDTTMDAYEQLKQYIVYMHLKDVRLKKAPFSLWELELTKDGKQMECVVFGEGIIPIKELYERMLQDGYEGRFALEYARPSYKVCDIQTHTKQVLKFIDYLEC